MKLIIKKTSIIEKREVHTHKCQFGQIGNAKLRKIMESWNDYIFYFILYYHNFPSQFVQIGSPFDQRRGNII